LILRCEDYADCFHKAFVDYPDPSTLNKAELASQLLTGGKVEEAVRLVVADEGAPGSA
jgi:hypothetical protein